MKESPPNKTRKMPNKITKYWKKLFGPEKNEQARPKPAAKNPSATLYDIGDEFGSHWIMACHFKCQAKMMVKPNKALIKAQDNAIALEIDILCRFSVIFKP